MLAGLDGTDVVVYAQDFGGAECDSSEGCGVVEAVGDGHACGVGEVSLVTEAGGHGE